MRTADAVALAKLFAEAGKIAQASVLRFTQVAGDLGARRVAGERNAATLLSSISGTSVGKARGTLAVAEKLKSAPEAERAFRNGDLSFEQAAVIAPVASQDPKAAGDLVGTARRASVKELKAEAARSLQRARGEEAMTQRERRLHKARFCRFSFPEDGGVRLEALFSTLQGAKVKAALEKATQDLFKERWRSGAREDTAEQVRADALADLLCGTRGSVRGAPDVLVRVDAGALRRGEVQDDEICEIDGLGPISVTAAKELLGEGFFTLVVQDGRDIKTVTSTKRAIPRRVSKALLFRDQHCVVPGCAETEQLEIDHWGRDYNWNGPTELANLCRLCRTHHKLKTEQGWQLLGGPGAWQWRPPKSIAELAAAHGTRLTCEPPRPLFRTSRRRPGETGPGKHDPPRAGP